MKNINGNPENISFAVLVCNELECVRGYGIREKTIMHTRTFFLILLLLVKPDGSISAMVINMITINDGTREAAKITAGKCIARVTEILRADRLHVACLTRDKGSNPTGRYIPVQLLEITCVLHDLMNCLKGLCILDTITIGVVVINLAELKREFHADKLNDANDNAFVEGFWSLFMVHPDTIFSSFKRSCENQVFSNIRGFLMRIDWGINLAIPHFSMYLTLLVNIEKLFNILYAPMND